MASKQARGQRREGQQRLHNETCSRDDCGFAVVVVADFTAVMIAVVQP